MYDYLFSTGRRKHLKYLSLQTNHFRNLISAFQASGYHQEKTDFLNGKTWNGLNNLNAVQHSRGRIKLHRAVVLSKHTSPQTDQTDTAKPTIPEVVYYGFLSNLLLQNNYFLITLRCFRSGTPIDTAFTFISSLWKPTKLGCTTVTGELSWQRIMQLVGFSDSWAIA